MMCVCEIIKSTFQKARFVSSLVTVQLYIIVYGTTFYQLIKFALKQLLWPCKYRCEYEFLLVWFSF